MPESAQPPPSFSDSELAAMRQEVLRWIDQNKKPRSGKPARATVFKRTSKGPTVIGLAAPEPTLPVAVIPPDPVKHRVEEAPALPPPVRRAPRRPVRAKGDVARAAVEPAHSRTSVVRRRKNAWRWWVGVAVGSCAVLAFNLWGIYRLGWSGRIARALSALLPLPAVYAGGETLTLQEYFRDLAAAAHQAASGAQAGTVRRPNREVVNRYISRVALRRLAGRYGVSVSDDTVQAALRQLASEAGSDQALASEIAREFPGWNLDDFRAKLLMPYLLRQAMYHVLFNDPHSWQEAERQALQIREQLRENKLSFTEAATRYSHEASAAVGGDIGYRSAAELEPEMWAQLRLLAHNETSPPIRTARGYLLVQRLEDAGEGSDLRIRLRQLLITPGASIDDLVSAEAKTLRVNRLVPD